MKLCVKNAAFNINTSQVQVVNIVSSVEDLKTF